MIPGFDSRYWDGQYPQGYDYDYVFIKSTEAHNFVTTPHLQLQTEGAKRAGLKRGYYHFYRYHSEPRAQAKWCYDNTPHDAELPLVIDLEDTRALKSLANVNNIKVLCAEVADLFGREPMIYTAAWWWNPYVFPYLGASGWDYNALDLWVANYTTAPQPYMPRGWTDWQVWQHIGDWSAPGFNAKIDVNRAKEAWYNKVIGQDDSPKEGILEQCTVIDQAVNRIRKLLEGI